MVAIKPRVGFIEPSQYAFDWAWILNEFKMDLYWVTNFLIDLDLPKLSIQSIPIAILNTKSGTTFQSYDLAATQN